MTMPFKILQTRKAGGGATIGFSPPPDFYQDYQSGMVNASFGISTSPSTPGVVWTWTKSGSTYASGNPTSGSASASFSCSLGAASGQVRSATFSVNASYLSQSYGPWSIELTTDNT